MTAQFARTPYRARSGGSSIAEPHAALLIDFDNVTMGIRSDLTKELKALLNSDIIKGKVAVQRAYADWRRYPQYIVPLAESSVDLIYAPAYGSAKKNATDIRLAIDALELVFTRPEIGTFILLSGDSDFSSLVLKLKEYGKYVIGVGIRESASDLLVQNCDEYYSYSALTGLTRAGEESPVVSEDPWELVDLAIRQMTDKGDVMRSDRLKQVLLEMDPGFDEKALGFQKFNKFLQEAATRGILALRKLENGQFEVELPSGDSAPAAVVEQTAEPKESRRGRGRRGRGRREDARPAAEPAAPEVAAEAPAELTGPEPEPVEPAAAVPAPVKPEPVSEVTPVQPAAARGSSLDLRGAYELLQRAVADLVRKNGAAVRDSDVKRRMLELAAGWDESALGFSKFSRFLRQAHDAEIITLRRIDGGNYEVVPGEGARVRIEAEAAEPPAAETRTEGRARGRGRRGGRERAEPAVQPVDEPAARVEMVAPAAAPAPTTEAPARAVPAAAAAAAPATGKAPAAPPASAFGFRRGSRGRAAPAGPPPLLEGQAARISQPGTAPAAPAAPRAERAAEQPSRPRERTRGTQKQKAPAKRDRASSATPARGTEQRKAAGALDAVSLGLPREAGEIANYIVTNYRGVGPRSVQTLIERFGATKVWDVLEKKPDEVRAVIGTNRGDRLLEAYHDDVSARRANATPPDGGPARAGKRATGSGRARASRGGRGRTTGR